MPSPLQRSPFSLEGKTILIVGADTPSGTAAARACADQGALVIAQNAFTPPNVPVDGLLYCAASPDKAADLHHIAASRLLAPAQAIEHLLSTHLLRNSGAVVLQKLSALRDPSINLEGGLHTLACSLALSAAPRRIRINIITAKAAPTPDELQDFAYAAVYLLSPASHWITGSNLIITGQPTL